MAFDAGGLIGESGVGRGARVDESVELHTKACNGARERGLCPEVEQLRYVALVVHPLVAAGGERRAGRHADRVVAVRVPEAGAARRQSVEIRRVHGMVAGTAEHAAVVQVRKQDPQVLR